MIQANKDRRDKARIAFHIPIVVIGVNEKAQIADFSLSGFFIQIDTTAALKEGRQVRLAMRFPHQKNLTIIKAKVVRTGENGFGCQFVDLDPVVHALLEKNFDIYSATLPIE
ncbi:MAG: PilZ domain-containing protein [Desulfatitalea sp.]|nr:PilZ domain-containing protein [Desulfatitalea sp.]